jgi:ribosomal subunit interface protein
MQIDIKTKNISLNQPLRTFCERVAEDLEKRVNLVEKEEGGMKATVKGWMEIGKTTLHHNKGPFFRAECQIFLPGKKIRAEAEAVDLRVAITEVKDETQRQLKEYKEKIIAQRRRGQRKIKKSLSLSPKAKIKRPKGARTREESI